MRLLHVTECYSSGVGQAIDTIVGMTPEHEHHLLYTGDKQPLPGVFASARELPEGIVARIRAVRQHSRAVAPDLIHAHSAWAGVYTRVLPQAAPVAYEPHAYKFIDDLLPAALRGAFWAAERLLGLNTAVVVTLSQEEERHAARLAPRARKVFLPNVARDLTPTVGARTRSVVMSGRISRQKDPHHFADVALALRAMDPDVDVVWLGTGDSDLESVLRAAGVRVTGWLGPEELAQELSTAGAYYHSARYEGFPLSLLDAAALEVPVVARQIAAFEGTGLRQTRSPAEAARTIMAVLDDPEARADALARGRTLLETMSPARQRAALAELYR